MEPILAATEARALPSLTDHLLEEILVRIRAPADLARATAACKTFHRLISHSNFLRYCRSLHQPLLLGFVGPGSAHSFLPAEAPAPHPNAPAVRAFAGTADFSFNHLPERGKSGWPRCDARDGRVLVICTDYERDLALPELAVCDPLTREYTLLPPIPEDLLASTLVQVQDDNIDFFDAFFDPSGGYQEARYRVMCWTRSSEMAAVFVYSSVTGSWTHGTAVSWNALGLNVQPDDMPCIGCWPSYAYECFYWHARVSSTKLIKLDINTMAFTTVSLPADHEDREVVVVEAGEGRIGMFSMDHENLQSLRYSILQIESENDDETAVETTIPLPCEYDIYFLHGAEQGYIFLVGWRRDRTRRSAFFSLEIKTLKIERLCLSNWIPDHLIPYFGFPAFIYH